MTSSDDHATSAPQPVTPRGLTSPCPLCRYVLDCPFDERYRLECLDFWPLARVEHRRLRVLGPASQRARQEALKIPWLREVIRTWERGGQVTDEQYLRLRKQAVRHRPDNTYQIYLYLLTEFLYVGLKRHVNDAISYYRLGPDFHQIFRPLMTVAVHGSLVLARDDMVAKDGATPVVSHFERLVYESFRLIVRSSCEVKEIVFPDDDDTFMDAVEAEWARALGFGNGYFGFTIFPLVSILDMVRYQHLGGRNRVISRSMVEQVIVSMDTFPLPLQLVVPEFRDVALKNRLIDMFQPLSGTCAVEAGRRLQHEGEERAAEAYPRLVEEFRSVLSVAIDQYAFMYGKSGTHEDAVGVLGFSAGPELREQVAGIIEEWGLPVDVKDLTHVNAANFLGARLRDHLRDHYPVPRDRTLSLDQPRGEGDQTLADFVADDEDPDDRAAAPLDVFVACTADGVQYLYVDEMADHAGVSSDQLRRWDKEGLVKAQRLGDIMKDRPAKVSASWRVYPYTMEMEEQIREVARRKAQRLGDLKEGEYSRGQAAAALGISTRTLQRWEDDGKARPERPNGRPVYSRDEIVRLDAVIQAEKAGSA